MGAGDSKDEQGNNLKSFSSGTTTTSNTTGSAKSKHKNRNSTSTKTEKAKTQQKEENPNKNKSGSKKSSISPSASSAAAKMNEGQAVGVAAKDVAAPASAATPPAEKEERQQVGGEPEQDSSSTAGSAAASATTNDISNEKLRGSYLTRLGIGASATQQGVTRTSRNSPGPNNGTNGINEADNSPPRSGAAAEGGRKATQQTVVDSVEKKHAKSPETTSGNGAGDNLFKPAARTGNSPGAGLFDSINDVDAEKEKEEAKPAAPTKDWQMTIIGENDTARLIPNERPDAFRHKFLQRLSYERIWVPQRERAPKHQTVIIFDWDDTLLCTSYLNLRLPTPEIPAHIQKQLVLLERVGCQLLELAMKLGTVFIITNAMKGWVEYSASKYIPRLMSTLQKMTIISARGNYEHAFPGNYGQWKIEAFLQVQRELNSSIITNLVSLGDSNMEMEAVHVMGKQFDQALIKTIKFRESPTPEELVKQLELVAQKFEKIILNARNLKIGLERKWSGNQQGGGGGSSQGHHQQQQQKSGSSKPSTPVAAANAGGASIAPAAAGTGPQATTSSGSTPNTSSSTPVNENSATGATSLHAQMLRDQQNKSSAQGGAPGAVPAGPPPSSQPQSSASTTENSADKTPTGGTSPKDNSFEQASDGSSVCDQPPNVADVADVDGMTSPRRAVITAEEKNEALRRAGFHPNEKFHDVSVADGSSTAGAEKTVAGGVDESSAKN
ncbi:unnamed protein product [Amoebophrya sp. A120]|nr:unnamed protein product [Amoebophrya sp. A120]|eukprot:GSA120T00019383001.1